MQNQRPFTTEDTKSTEKSKIATKQQAEALVKRIGEACDELERLAEENPELVGRVTRGAEEHKDAYLRLKARLQMADAAPRCRWVRQDGTSCGSPQMKNHIYCFAHRQMAEAQALALRLPPPEDANAIQVGLMRIQKALIEDTITTKKAGLLLYSMQLALTNVGQTTFGQAKDEEMVQETVSEEEAFSQNQEPFTAKDAKGAKGSGERQNQHQNRTPLTTEDTEDTEKEKGLPQMDADGRGLQDRVKQVEWKPSADMYRMDTQEGREAYEASCRMKIAPRLCAEGRPPHPWIAANDRAENHADLG